MITIKKKIHFSRGTAGRRRITAQPPAIDTVPDERIPRISKLMALAIHFDGMIREGKVKDMSELARLSHVTQPRMTQIMNLLYLATDIQEELLFLPSIASNGGFRIDHPPDNFTFPSRRMNDAGEDLRFEVDARRKKGVAERGENRQGRGLEGPAGAGFVEMRPGS
jgi:hypothetical protein